MREFSPVIALNSSAAVASWVVDWLTAATVLRILVTKALKCVARPVTSSLPSLGSCRVRSPSPEAISRMAEATPHKGRVMLRPMRSTTATTMTATPSPMAPNFDADRQNAA